MIPQYLTHYGAGLLFLVFGLKLLYEAFHMKSGAASDELREVEEELMEEEKKFKHTNKHSKLKFKNAKQTNLRKNNDYTAFPITDMESYEQITFHFFFVAFFGFFFCFFVVFF